jgi:TPP-dependent pyruvate/acetoin dehydrogenase alpha subunit
MVATASDASTAAELPSNDVLRWMFEHLVLIREFEERVAALRQSGVLQGSAHLYVGQEAVAVGVCARLNKDDYVASTHRGAWARHRQGCRRGAHDGRALRPGHGHE